VNQVLLWLNILSEVSFTGFKKRIRNPGNLQILRIHVQTDESAITDKIEKQEFFRKIHLEYSKSYALGK
jgi:hypothetical protein